MTVEAIVDTGFSDYLTLPPSVIEVLQLPYLQTSYGGLADGSTKALDLHDAIVEWEGGRRRVPVYATCGQPLLGMGMLYGHQLTLSIVDGGDLMIMPLT